MTFCCQGVTEPLLASDGSPIPAGSIDVVNASGVVGHHLTSETVSELIRELSRVLRPGGVAMLDVGPTLRARALNALMTASGFQVLGRWRSWFLDPTGQVVFRKSG